MPKAFTRRGEGEPYYRQVRDMVFEVTPEFKTWFSDMSRELVANRRAGKLKPTYENIEAGLVDFKALAAPTWAKLRTSYTKGQTLGNSRKTAAAAKTASVKKRTTRAKK